MKNAKVGSVLITTTRFLSSSFIIATPPVSAANPDGCWKRSFYVSIATTMVHTTLPNRILHYAQNTSSLIGAGAIFRASRG